MEFYKQCDFETCLKLAPLGQTDARNSRGTLKRHTHQSCLETTAVDAFRKLLLKKRESLKACRSFTDLLDWIEKIAKEPKCSGIGTLCCYDTADRIGSHLGCEPGSIYLHAGVTVGARKLGIDVRGKKFIPVDHLRIPKEFRHYSAAHLENILCIYKDSFE